MMSFDDKRRAFEARNEGRTLKPLERTMRGTPTFDAWMSVYMNADNTTVDYAVEPDNVTYTFYAAHNKPKESTTNV